MKEPYTYERKQAALVKHSACQVFVLARLQVYEDLAAENDWSKPAKVCSHDLTPQQWREALDMLEAMGQPRCLILPDDLELAVDLYETANYPRLMPRHTVRRDVDGLWVRAHLYAAADITAYLTLIGDSTLTAEEVAMQCDSGEYYGGPGRKFRSEGYAKQSRARWIHYQSGGLDI